MKHTPGPWEINTARGRLPAIRRIKMPHGEADTFQARIQVASGPPFKSICLLDFGYNDKNAEANARLIAAAPNLLEACRKIIQFHDEVFPGPLAIRGVFIDHTALNEAYCLAERIVKEIDG